MIAVNVRVQIGFEIKGMPTEQWESLCEMVIEDKPLTFEQLKEIYPLDKVKFMLTNLTHPQMDRSSEIGMSEIQIEC